MCDATYYLDSFLLWAGESPVGGFLLLASGYALGGVIVKLIAKLMSLKHKQNL